MRWEMPWKNKKFEEEAISEILLPDTDLESGAEASEAEDEFDKEKEEPLQMGHELKDTLHDYWSRLMAAHSRFAVRPLHEIFKHTALFAKCRKCSMWVCVCINHSQALN